MAEDHIAGCETDFLAICCTPDVCKVGDVLVPFDCFQTLDRKKKYCNTVRARGVSVLNVGSVIAGTQSNAGSGVISGTSLGSGDCIILTGSPTVRVEGSPAARHNSDVGMNNQNCLGKLQTFLRPPIVFVQNNAIPCNDPPVSSPLLEWLLKRQQDISNSPKEKMRQFVDASKYIDSAEAWAKDKIDKLPEFPPVPESNKDASETERTVRNWVNQELEKTHGQTQAVLDFGTGIVSGIANMLNMAGQYYLKDPNTEPLDALILMENIRLGNVCKEGVEKQIGAVWDNLKNEAIKAWDDYQNGTVNDKARTEARAVLEIITLPIVELKAGALSKLGKVEEVIKGAGVLKQAEDVKAAEKLASAVADARSGVKIVRATKEGAAFGEKVAHDEMLARKMEPVGKTDGVYRDGTTGIDGIYKNSNPPPDYIITEAKYNTASLEKGLADGSNQMDDMWVRKRLQDKVGMEEAGKISDAMKEGRVEKWKIQVKPDGSTSISQIDHDGNVIRGNAGKVK